MIEKIKRRAVNYIFNSRTISLDESIPFELSFLSSYEKNLYSASYSFVKGDEETSLEFLLKSIEINPHDFRGFLNLNFTLSQLKNKYRADKALHLLSKLKEKRINNVFLSRSICNLKIFLDKNDHSIAVDNYLKEYINPSIINKTSEKPIFFWHIPKCGGTSFSSYISNNFLRIKPHYMSAYDSEFLHKYIIENRVGALPFISSTHLTAKSLDLNKIKDQYFQVAIIRDPVKRATSSWRQYYQNPAQRLSIIQQHGSYWDYFPKANLAEWAIKVPKKHSNAITATFSEELNSQEAVDYINTMDLWGLTSDINNLIKVVCEKYGLDFNSELIPSKLNATNKNLVYQKEEAKSLRSVLIPDLQTFTDVLNAR